MGLLSQTGLQVRSGGVPDAAPVRAELVLAPALDRVWVAADLAPARGWAQRPVRQRLAQVPVA